MLLYEMFLAEGLIKQTNSNIPFGNQLDGTPAAKLLLQVVSRIFPTESIILSRVTRCYRVLVQRVARRSGTFLCFCAEVTLQHVLYINTLK